MAQHKLQQESKIRHFYRGGGPVVGGLLLFARGPRNENETSENGCSAGRFRLLKLVFCSRIFLFCFFFYEPLIKRSKNGGGGALRARADVGSQRSKFRVETSGRPLCATRGCGDDIRRHVSPSGVCVCLCVRLCAHTCGCGFGFDVTSLQRSPSKGLSPRS